MAKRRPANKPASMQASDCPPDLTALGVNSANATRPGRERVDVNIDRLDEAIRKSARSLKDIFESARVEPKNYVNWRNGSRAFRKTLELIAIELSVDVRQLILDGSLPTFESVAVLPKVRKLSGEWKLEGGDIKAPQYFDYAIEPKKLSGRIRLEQDENGGIFGEGVDHDAAPLHFEGEFIGEDFLRGNYDIGHPRMSRVSGVVAGKLESCGTIINGKYLGRVVDFYGPGIDFLLGWFQMTLEGSRDD